MSETTKIRVAENGYGVIGKRVADAVVRQEVDRADVVRFGDKGVAGRLVPFATLHDELHAAAPIAVDVLGCDLLRRAVHDHVCQIGRASCRERVCLAV